MTHPPSHQTEELDQLEADTHAVTPETPTTDEPTGEDPDEELVKVTPILLMIGVAAVILGVAAGLIMSFTATGHG